MHAYSEETDTKKTTSIVRNRALAFAPALVLIASILFDRYGMLSFSIISVACVFSLVIFSFLLPSRVLVGWTIVYILAITATLWTRRYIWTGSSGNTDALVATRSLVAASAGMLACLLAKRREQNHLVVREINRLLDQMEIPMITSDGDGWIVHVNPKAHEQLGGEITQGSPFFEHFSVVTEKGRSIKSYVDLVTGAVSGPVTTSLAVGPYRSQVHPAVMLRVDIGERRQVMTLLYPPHPTPSADLTDQ